MADSVGKGFPTANLQVGHIFCDIDDLTLWKFLGGDPRLVSSWVLIGGQVQSQPDTSLWGINQAGARWFFNGSYYGWDGTQIIQVAFGIGLNIYDYKIDFTLQDDFTTGGQTTGEIGAIGWQGAGTLTVQAGEINRPGIFRVNTGAVSGTQARINFANSPSFNRLFAHEISWVVRSNNNDANTTMRIGAANSVAADPPNDGIYFEKLDADTNWFCVTRISSGGPARINSGVPVSDSSFFTFKYKYTGTAIQFYINNVLVGTEVITLSGGLISPYVFIINSAAAAKTMDIDYFEIIGATSR